MRRMMRTLLLLLLSFLTRSGAQIVRNVTVEDDDLFFLALWSNYTYFQLKVLQQTYAAPALLANLTSFFYQQDDLALPAALRIALLRSNLDAEFSLNASDATVQVFTAKVLQKATPRVAITVPLLANMSSGHLGRAQAAAILESAAISPAFGLSTVSASPAPSLASVPAEMLLAAPSARWKSLPPATLARLIQTPDKASSAQWQVAFWQLAALADSGSMAMDDLVSSALAGARTTGNQPLKLMPSDVFLVNMERIVQKLGDQLPWLPPHLVYAWRDRNNPDLVQSARALSLDCLQLKAAGAVNNILELTAVYSSTLDLLNAKSLVKRTVPLQLRKCSMNKFRQVLKQRSLTGGGMGQLKEDDLHALGHYFLTDFTIEEVNRIENSSLKKAFVEKIGQAPLMELMTLTSVNYLRQLADLFMLDFNGRRPLNDLDLKQLGTLALFLSPDKMKVTNVKAALPGYLDSLLFGKQQSRRWLCLTKSNAQDLKDALIETYGNPAQWNASLIKYLGPNMYVLNDTERPQLNATALLQSLAALMAHREPLFDFFPGYLGSVTFSKACQRWLGNETDSSYFTSSQMAWSRIMLSGQQLAVNLALANSSSSLANFTRGGKTANVYFTLDQAINKFLNGSSFANLSADTKSIIVRLGSEVQLNATQKLKEFLTDKNFSSTENAAQLTERFKKEVAEQKISKTKQIELSDFLINTRSNYIKQMILLLNMTPNDANTSAENFCSTIGIEYCVQMGLVQPMFLTTQLTLPSAFNCFGIKAAGRFAAAASLQDLSAWTSDDLDSCLDVLGGIEYLSPEVKSHIWSRLKDRYGTLRWNDLLSWNYLLEALSPGDESRIDFRLPLVTDWIPILAKSGIKPTTLSDKVSASNELDTKAKYAEEDLWLLQTMTPILCSFSQPIIEKMLQSSKDPDDFLQSVGGLTLKCSNRSILNLLAKKAKALKPIKDWTASDISAWGIIVAGLPEEDLATLSAKQFAALTPAAAALLTNSQLKAIRAPTFEALSAEAMSLIQESQTKDLNPKMMAKMADFGEYIHPGSLAQRRMDFNGLDWEDYPEHEGRSGASCFRQIVLSPAVTVLLFVLNFFMLP